MKHLPYTPTPVIDLPYFSHKLGVHLRCKRDDLFMHAGGGSKSRMLQYILADVHRDNYDVAITADGFKIIETNSYSSMIDQELEGYLKDERLKRLFKK